MSPITGSGRIADLRVLAGSSLLITGTFGRMDNSYTKTQGSHGKDPAGTGGLRK